LPGEKSRCFEVKILTTINNLRGGGKCGDSWEIMGNADFYATKEATAESFIMSRNDSATV